MPPTPKQNPPDPHNTTTTYNALPPNHTHNLLQEHTTSPTPTPSFITKISSASSPPKKRSLSTITDSSTNDDEPLNPPKRLKTTSESHSLVTPDGSLIYASSIARYMASRPLTGFRRTAAQAVGQRKRKRNTSSRTAESWAMGSHMQTPRRSRGDTDVVPDIPVSSTGSAGSLDGDLLRSPYITLSPGSSTHPKFPESSSGMKTEDQTPNTIAKLPNTENNNQIPSTPLLSSSLATEFQIPALSVDQPRPHAHSSPCGSLDEHNIPSRINTPSPLPVAINLIQPQRLQYLINCFKSLTRLLLHYSQFQHHRISQNQEKDGILHKIKQLSRLTTRLMAEWMGRESSTPHRHHRYLHHRGDLGFVEGGKEGVLEDGDVGLGTTEEDITGEEEAELF
ncbi:unnamed protein product [Periconia digitata]|uniref:Uncharacterized protein n=1 Tax=Periconia digitata TaxID=1303443 RepID=A0A9W4UL85_9PLEO|nr:unnamed protein product [Periconia digitata]